MTTLWRSLIRGLARDAETAAGASEAQVSLAEQSVGVAFPGSLRALLLECNGVRADNGCGVVWSCDELASRNRELRSTESFRELYMPFGNMLFFAEDGGGDLFAFAIAANGQIPNGNVYRWDHETDGRPWFAGSLRQYLERRLSPSYHERTG